MKQTKRSLQAKLRCGRRWKRQRNKKWKRELKISKMLKAKVLFKLNLTNKPKNSSCKRNSKTKLTNYHLNPNINYLNWSHKNNTWAKVWPNSFHKRNRVNKSKKKCSTPKFMIWTWNTRKSNHFYRIQNRQRKNSRVSWVQRKRLSRAKRLNSLAKLSHLNLSHRLNSLRHKP